MISFSYEIDIRGASVYIRDEEKRIDGKIRVTVKDLAFKAFRMVRLLYRTRLKVRSGTLWKGVTIERTAHRSGVFIVGGYEEWTVRSTAPYAAAQEGGATIRPVRFGVRFLRGRTVGWQLKYGSSRGKRLFIPSPRMRTRAGVLRAGGRDAFLERLSRGRAFSTFVRGNALLASIRLGPGRYKVEFVGAVVRRVTLRGRGVVETVARHILSIAGIEAERKLAER